jgi:hypothetical protein
MRSGPGSRKRWRSAPYGPLGAPVFGFGAVHDTEHKQRTELHLTSFTGDPHASIVQLGETTALAHCGQRRIIMGFSATAYMPGGTMHHLIVEPTWYVPDDITGRLIIRKLVLTDEDNNPIQISGTADLDRDRAHHTMGRSLWKHASQQLRKLASNPQSAHRARMLIAVTSYQGGQQLAEGMIGAGANPEDIAVATRADEIDNPMRRRPVWCEIASGSLARFGQHPTAKILIAPLAVAERGLNMVDRQGRSLVGQVILAVRPIPVMDEPAQLLALISGRAYSDDDPSAEPAERLKKLSFAATRVREELFRSHHYFQSLPDQVRRSIVAEMLIGIIQLGGRVRRGGDTGYIYLADYAFYDKRGKSDLPRLINELVTEWTDNQQLALIQAVYGNTFNAISDFANRK